MSAPPGPPPGGPPRMVPGPPPGGPMYGQGAYPGFPGMPPPPLMPNFPPPLPPGWSEHTAPDGVTKYYYNAETKASTYKRPALGAPAPDPAAGGPAAGAAATAPKKKKDKAKAKVPIPGTDWLRVTTGGGDVFYFDKENKRSEWSIPEEIAEAVAAFEAAERAEKEEKIKQERLERMKEKERVRLEVEEERRARQAAAEERKRKATDAGPSKPAKVAKVDKDEEEYQPAEEEDPEAWMKAVAAEFAEADAAKAADEADAEERDKKAEEEAAKKVFTAQTAVKVSPEEGRALFKALLMDKNISPFAPWDQSLPLFIADPRYILLPSAKARREVYEEYCRDAGRLRRLNKAPAAVEVRADPERDYRALMREEVASTRTRFDDFKRKHKKDRRFYSFGRDDREREKAFKVHLRELGERKRADAARAEADFFELLKETTIVAGAAWSDVKRKISNDPRYDAVGSSSLRAELFETHVKKLATDKPAETAEEAAERKLRERKERQSASLRERQGQVAQQQAQVAEDVDKSRASAGREEAERLYGSLLVDVVRSFDVTWQDTLPILQQDKRFAHPSLRMGDKHRLFDEHVARLGATKSDALNKLFGTAAPELHTSYDEAYKVLADDPLIARLGLAGAALEERFNAWRRARDAEARREFDALLAENRYVDFWGRMRKKVLDENAAGVEEDERDAGEGLGDGGDADMIALAQKMDLDEVKVILRRDKRYRQFDHVPEKRERWLSEYLENMEGSRGSETVHAVQRKE